MKDILLIITFLISPAFFSQEVKWGKVSQEEIDLKEVPFEPQADAVILMESGELKIIDYGYKLTEYGRTKILAESGLKNAKKKWSFVMRKRYDNVVLKDAQTINFIDGKTIITPVDKKDIIISRNNEAEEISITFPNVRVGSIIEYKVVITRPYDLYSSPWRFQNSIPTLASKLNIEMATNSRYIMILKGAKLSKKYQGRENVRELELFNIPSDKVIKNVYNINDYRERVMLQYTSAGRYYGTYYSENSWNGFKALISNDIEKSIRNINFVTIAAAIKNGSNKLETLKNCIKHLRENFKLNGYAAIKTTDIKNNFLHTKIGNTADFNILLNEILKIKNIKSELAINSLRSNGQIIVTYPAFSKLQTLVNIVEIDNGKKLMIDAATSDPENLQYLSLDYFNTIVLGLNSPIETFLAVTPTISEFNSLRQLNIKDNNTELKIENHSKGYFNSESYNGDDYDFASGINNDANQNQQQDGWKYSTQNVTNENPANSLYQIESPFSKTIKNLTVDKDRSFPIELNFPFLATIELKTKFPENYQTESEDFNQKISAFEDHLQYIQNIKTINGESIFNWSLIINKIFFSTDEISEYNTFMERVDTAMNKTAQIKKKQ